MTRDAAHPLGFEIVDRSAQDHASDFFSRCDARPDILWREKTRIDHLQRLEYFPGAKLVQLHPGRALGHFTKDDEIEVAVEEGGARRLGRCLSTQHTECT